MGECPMKVGKNGIYFKMGFFPTPAGTKGIYFLAFLYLLIINNLYTSGAGFPCSAGHKKARMKIQAVCYSKLLKKWSSEYNKNPREDTRGALLPKTPG